MAASKTGPKAPKVRTEENAKVVKASSALGVPHEDIARELGMSVESLQKYYGKELDEGRTQANKRMAQCLFKAAESGNVAAAMFWLKTRAGWRETNRVETEVSGGMTVTWEK